MAGMQYQEKTAQENLQHPVVDAVFFVHKSAKKYEKNKNSVYWMIENVENSKKKQKGAKKTRKMKNKKNRKKIEKESERLEAVRLRSAPKAP